MNAPTQEQVDALKNAHGELVYVDARGGTRFVFRGPGRSEWAMFVAKQTKQNANIQAAVDELCNHCLVWPEAAGAAGNRFPGDIAQWTAALERQPALSLQVANRLGELAGNGEDGAAVGKL